MADTQEPNEQQKKKYIVEALGIAGYIENPDFPRIYTKEDGNDTIVVDLTAGSSVYFMKNKQRIVIDDDQDTLAKVSKMITEAEDGQMPARTKSDIIIANPATSSAPATKLPKPQTSTQVMYAPQGRMIKDISPGLKETGKIKIGRKGATKTSNTGTKYRPPEKFDHFEIVTVYKDDNGDFIPDAAVMSHVGPDAKELDVTLLYNDPTLNFMTRYNQYKGGKCMCSGDGIEGVTADGTIIECDPNTCPAFATKKCKPNGILSVILKDAPRLGGVYKFRTTSYNSIRSILSSMFFIQSLTGGVLASIPLKMTLSPMSVNPIGSPTAQTIYVVNLEFPGGVDELHKQTIKIMEQRTSMHTQIASLEQQARVALDMPETKEEIEDIEAEFYPDTQGAQE